MYDWIETEIAGIQESDIEAPEHTSNEFETIVPGAIISVRLRKMHARSAQLRKQVEAIFAERGLISYDENGHIDMMIAPPEDVLRLIHPFMQRAVSLENAICASLMSEYDLWQHASVVIGDGWEVYFQTHDQEQAQEKAYQKMMRESFSEIEFMDDNLELPKSFDPDLN